MEAIKEEDILQDSDSFYMRVPDARKLVAVLNELSSRIEAVEGKPSYVGRVDYVNFPANREDMIPREKEPSTDVGWERACEEALKTVPQGDFRAIKDFITHQKEISYREGQEFADVEGQKSVWVAQGVGIGKKEVIEKVREWALSELDGKEQVEFLDWLYTLT